MRSYLHLRCLLTFAEEMSHNDQTRIEIAEIVYEKPPSGLFSEVLFGSDGGNTLWVKFSDRDGIYEWIGKFGCGHSTSMRVHKVIEPDYFVVVAGGYAYLVDATKRQLLNQYCAPNLHDIAYDPKFNRFIVADVRLRIIENGVEVWASRRISLDGIHSMSIQNRTLSGTTVVGYEGEEDCFAFDIDSREFISGPDFSSCDISNSESKKIGWWKFWKFLGKQ